MPRYMVYIEQVNQTFYEVEAPDKQRAAFKARKQWAAENTPSVLSVDMVGATAKSNHQEANHEP